MSIDYVTRLSVGTLNDIDIFDCCKNGLLIEKNFDKECIKQACYELRAGYTYYDISDDAKRYEINEGEYILLKPKQIISIITQESLSLPTNMIGRVLAKGSLFSLGIIPVNTYADPGFSGNLGIVLNNLSNNFIKIFPKDSIAKIEFSKMARPVSKPYNGQHGYQTHIWPIRKDLILTPEEYLNENRIYSKIDEIRISYGDIIADAFRRVYVFESTLIISAAVYFVFNLILIGWLLSLNSEVSQIVTPLMSVGLGILSNIAYATIVYFISRPKRKSKK